MNTGSLAGACLCALLLPATALAQSGPRPLLGGHGNNVQAFITQHDDDRDGRITAADFAAFRRARFDATDRNHDGSVDEDEYVAEFRQRRQQALEQERSAQAAHGRQRFAALDADGDGQVSRAEFDAAGAQDWARGQAALTAAGKAPPGDRTQAFDRDGGRPGMPDSQAAEGFLALYDENGDGKVGRKEYADLRAAQFASADGDRNAALSPDEYRVEFEDRLNRRLTALEQADDRQVHVRFKVLDTDKDQRMTFAEYQASGLRTFARVDRNHDGVVDASDAALPPPAPATAPATTPARAD
ncbi:calcium-binding protein [Xanthomonas arboricola pv. juglandis]|uniref:EF-hand domain-containing protein n=1 Tax=Xanthomonas TaxID=338 RepID=UPI000E5B039E|nr:MULTISPECIES: EF-hand domain-containing protein [Xanthomonas]CAD1797120.1 EF-hand domain-containing protein [Xanthomonas sp. CPBF 426]CAG2097058.1 EF-hand domain-containing protein [Xanthomonas euroxanthea]SYZ57184.1 calcium-binding protein [Xanthomonas arboricola pv. juglandis]